MRKILCIFSIFSCTFLSSCTLTKYTIVEGVYESFNTIDHSSIYKAKLVLTSIDEDIFATSNQLNVITDYYSSSHYAFNLYFYIIESSSYVLMSVKDFVYQKGTSQTYIGYVNSESIYFTIESSLTFIYSDTIEIIWREDIDGQSIEYNFRFHLITN